MKKIALLLGVLAAMSFWACMETGPDAPSRTNGCIGVQCENTDPADSGSDAAQSSDAPVGLVDPIEPINVYELVLLG